MVKGVKLQLALPAGTTLTEHPIAFPYRSGTETLQVNNILLRGLVKHHPQQSKKDTAAQSYLPHWKLRQSRRRVVTLRAHVEGPEGGPEMVVPVAVVNLAPWSASCAAAAVPSSAAPVTPPGGVAQPKPPAASATPPSSDGDGGIVSASVKVDFRFQMETVKFSLSMKQTGDFREDAGLQVEAVLMGTVSHIQ